MKHHTLISSKDKNEKSIVSSAAGVLGALRVKIKCLISFPKYDDA